METSFSLHQARALLASDDADGKALDAVDTLLTFVLAGVPAITGLSSALGQLAVALLGVKAEMARAGKSVLDHFRRTARTTKSVTDRDRRLLAANTMAFYASFFEALDEKAPRKRSRKAGNAIDDLRRAVAALPDRGAEASQLQHLGVPVPHPLDSWQLHIGHIDLLHNQLASTLLAPMVAAGHFSASDVASIAANAKAHYRRYYIELALENHDFFAWSMLGSAQLQDRQLKQLQALVTETTDSLSNDLRSTGIGLARIESLVGNLPDAIARKRVATVLEQLQNAYNAVLERTVIVEATSGGDAPDFVSPTAGQLFVPQAYHVIRYTGSERLEDETTWARREVREDLGAFLMQSLRSPFSEECPLIILGHPGSGKSLLTNVIAARLGRGSLTTIRVELRNVPGEIEIATQIEDQIRRQLGIAIGWGELATTLPESGGLLLLDGYDELLQVTGKVHAGYLTRIQQFQMNELAVRKRPVRVIVTSRLNLIDKATIPRGATVIRLREFDETRQRKWISIWNRSNEKYFSARKSEPFRLPKNPAAAELARQPLLLLMLAIYDSDGNALLNDDAINQTKLYDRLIRRFVVREAAKSTAFQSLGTDARSQVVERRVEGLGVAAIGMLIRRSLFLREQELNRDLRFFRYETSTPIAEGGEDLSPAARLVGSFFFIHQARALSAGGTADRAFEFMHNTFGEFLTADFILRRIIIDCRNLSVFGSDQWMAGHAQHQLADPRSLSNWHDLLAMTPLVSRPNILRMIVEWLPEYLERTNLSAPDFRKQLSAIVHAQLTAVISSSQPVDLTAALRSAEFPTGSAFEHMAVYTLNLLTLATLLSGETFILPDSVFSVATESTPQWHRIMRLWQSWLSNEVLMQVGSVLTIRRISAGTRFDTNRHPPTAAPDRLTALATAAEAIGDGLTAGLALIVRATGAVADEELEYGVSLLRDEGVDVEVQYAQARIRAARNRYVDASEAAAMIRDAMAIIGARWIGSAAPLLFDTIDFARSVGFPIDDIRKSHPAPWERVGFALRRDLVSGFADPSGHLPHLTQKVVADFESLPVDVLAAHVDAILAFGDIVDIERVASVLNSLPKPICPRLLFASLRVAMQVLDRRWVDDLYKALVAAPPGGEPIWQTVPDPDDAAIIDFYVCALNREDYDTAAGVRRHLIQPRIAAHGRQRQWLENAIREADDLS